MYQCEKSFTPCPLEHEQLWHQMLDMQMRVIAKDHDPSKWIIGEEVGGLLTHLLV
jgi:hypothetical protein